jgi:hypothetical protein
VFVLYDQLVPEMLHTNRCVSTNGWQKPVNGKKIEVNDSKKNRNTISFYTFIFIIHSKQKNNKHGTKKANLS